MLSENGAVAVITIQQQYPSHCIVILLFPLSGFCINYQVLKCGVVILLWKYFTRSISTSPSHCIYVLYKLRLTTLGCFYTLYVSLLMLFITRPCYKKFSFIFQQCYQCKPFECTLIGKNRYFT
ncbi:unnamed protein product [Prunus brigantina]